LGRFSAIRRGARLSRWKSAPGRCGRTNVAIGLRAGPTIPRDRRLSRAPEPEGVSASPGLRDASLSARVADNHLVTQTLAFARHWWRLAEFATVQPLNSIESLAAPLAPSSARRSPTTRAPARGWTRCRHRRSYLGWSPPPGLAREITCLLAGSAWSGRERRDQDRAGRLIEPMSASVWRNVTSGERWSARQPKQPENAAGESLGFAAGTSCSISTNWIARSE
jgi:hypothetical protein